MQGTKLIHFMMAVLVSVFFFTTPGFAQVSSSNCTLLGRRAEGPCFFGDVAGDVAYFGNGRGGMFIV